MYPAQFQWFKQRAAATLPVLSNVTAISNEAATKELTMDAGARDAEQTRKTLRPRMHLKIATV
jgi:hypothetical protein